MTPMHAARLLSDAPQMFVGAKEELAVADSEGAVGEPVAHRVDGELLVFFGRSLEHDDVAILRHRINVIGASNE